MGTVAYATIGKALNGLPMVWEVRKLKAHPRIARFWHLQSINWGRPTDGRSITREDVRGSLIIDVGWFDSEHRPKTLKAIEKALQHRRIVERHKPSTLIPGGRDDNSAKNQESVCLYSS